MTQRITMSGSLLFVIMLFKGMEMVAQQNVGIGTTNPMEKLHIQFGNLRLDEGEFQSWGNIVLHPDVDATGDDAILFKDGTGNEVARLNTDGRFGLGTNTPQTTMELELPFGTTSITSGIQFNASERRWRMTVGGADAISAAHFQLLYKNHDASVYTPRLTVTHDGKVGIGTTSPQSPLAVNGMITCKEVEVTLAGWPDYVFKEGYELRPLHEVEAFINQYQHLPDVPSEKEIKTEGLHLGEMQAILMEKVEELTLYLIELKKENETLEKRIILLEEQ